MRYFILFLLLGPDIVCTCV